MVQVSHSTYDIQRVREVRPCDKGMQVVFSTGLSVCLPKGHSEYERILRQARSSLQSGEPVGLRVSEASELTELHGTHQSAVRRIRSDEEDPNRLLVEFWAYSPVCYLTKDHPDFERIKQTLERAVTMDQQVIVANHLRMVEGDTETWWKIMDVRPA